MKPLELVLIGAAMFAVGFNVGDILSRPDRLEAAPMPPPPQIWFQKNDCTFKEDRIQPEECRFEITPKTMTLSFVTKEYFDTQVKNALGFSRIDRDPCEIVIPAGATITSIPSRGVALWSYDYKPGKPPMNIEQTLVHEILHCYVGRWHPEPAALAMIEFREHQKTKPETEARFFHFHFPRLPAQNFELNKWQW